MLTKEGRRLTSEDARPLPRKLRIRKLGKDWKGAYLMLTREAKEKTKVWKDGDTGNELTKSSLLPTHNFEDRDK